MNFENIYALENVNDSFNFFYDKLHSAYNTSFPIKKKKKQTSSKAAWNITDYA